MKTNPFISSIFVEKWIKHFIPEDLVYQFRGVDHVSFYKKKLLPLYVNLGRNLTKGLSYNLSLDTGDMLKGKVLLIYDIPTYFNTNNLQLPESIGLIKVEQYPGFLIDLEKFEDITSYLQATFSKSSRYKLKKYWKRFETCFEVKYTMYWGEMDPEQFNYIFDCFYELLQKRFKEKAEYNNNLDLKEWSFYKEIAYPMILKEKASLFVIYNATKPIAITLNFLDKEILIDAITVFDTDYAKFHLGSINIIKQIEWSLEQNFKIFDFSKGFFDYKERWSTLRYSFNYHILYDTSSLVSKGIANSLSQYYKLKKVLRDRGLNRLFHRLRFKSGQKKSVRSKMLFDYVPYNETIDVAQLMRIGNPISSTTLPVNLLFDFLYLNQTRYKELEVFEVVSTKNQFLFQVGDKKVLATINNVA